MANEAPPLEQQDNEEISCKEMLKNLLTDKTLKDIWLKGTDGEKVGASRAVLAARSLVFRRMLFGEFSETGSSTVPIGFHSTVLKAIVEYIHTDTAEILKKTKKGKGASLSFHQVQTVISLIGAAMYFQFPGLSRKAKTYLEETLASSPSISFAVLEACQQEGPSVPTEIKELTWKNIRGNVNGIIVGPCVEVLSASLLEDILQDDEMEVYEFELFQLLQQWVTGSGSHENSAKGTVPSLVSGGRSQLASEMTKHIKMERIDATFLSTEVASSGLVSQEELFEAYMQQALAAQKQAVVHRNWLRKVPVWKSTPSKNSETAWLDFPPIKSGTYRWTIMVEKRGHYLWLGIQEKSGGKMSLFAHLVNGNGIGMFDNGQSKADRTDLNMLKFESGSKITFVLNLTPSDNQNGTLCASVDGKPMAQLFSGLQDRLDGNSKDGKGYTPAFAFKEPARCRLLNIEKV